MAKAGQKLALHPRVLVNAANDACWRIYRCLLPGRSEPVQEGVELIASRSGRDCTTEARRHGAIGRNTSVSSMRRPPLSSGGDVAPPGGPRAPLPCVVPSWSTIPSRNSEGVRHASIRTLVEPVFMGLGARGGPSSTGAAISVAALSGRTHEGSSPAKTRTAVAWTGRFRSEGDPRWCSTLELMLSCRLPFTLVESP